MYTKVWFPRIRYAYAYRIKYAYNKCIPKFDFQNKLLITNDFDFLV